jgi:hypothetical protein
MRFCIAVSLLVIFLAAPLAAQEDGIRVQRPTLIGGEIGGKALIYCLNVERYFTNNVGIGAGLMGFGTSDGFIGLLPIYGVLALGNIHSFYLAAGGDLAAGSSNWDTLDSTFIGVAAIGYMYHSESGFFVRPTMNLLFKESFLVLPGIAFGGSF